MEDQRNKPAKIDEFAASQIFLLGVTFRVAAQEVM